MAEHLDHTRSARPKKVTRDKQAEQKERRNDLSGKQAFERLLVPKDMPEKLECLETMLLLMHPKIKIPHMAYTLARRHFTYADASKNGEDRTVAE